MERIDYTDDGHARAFNGVDVFAMTALASALTLYAKHKIRVNRSYTPSAMMRTGRLHLGAAAARSSGFYGIKSRDYYGMAAALRHEAAVRLDREGRLLRPGDSTRGT